ncbi:MAG: D-alanyl-D-alanine carboxypeptidase family protein [Candidatus Sumerlaeaceae bacterium]|nr:D-alanyl-D-alanine carboxypeptidase family protein [Candidatus Sumerlaeaceae bacterium]
MILNSEGNTLMFARRWLRFLGCFLAATLLAPLCSAQTQYPSSTPRPGFLGSIFKRKATPTPVPLPEPEPIATPTPKPKPAKPKPKPSSSSKSKSETGTSKSKSDKSSSDSTSAKKTGEKEKAKTAEETPATADATPKPVAEPTAEPKAEASPAPKADKSAPDGTEDMIVPVRKKSSEPKSQLLPASPPGVSAAMYEPGKYVASARTVNSDYRTRPTNGPVALVVNGKGWNGQNLPIGGEDAYRKTLPLDYMPTDLVLIPKELCYCGQVLYLRREAAESYIRMVTDAAREGLNIKIFSAYRDISHQQRLYSEAVRRGGRGQKMVARPGYSEHMLGTTVDVTSTEKYLMKRSFGNSPEGKWLAKNGARYGWKITVIRGSGPRAHTDEPWHIRYFGKALNNSGTSSQMVASETETSKSPFKFFVSR